jgi:hypothetical protein
MNGIISCLSSKFLASGLFSGFLSKSYEIISLIKGETIEGRGAGSLSLINFIISKLLSASNGSLPVKN